MENEAGGHFGTVIGGSYYSFPWYSIVVGCVLVPRWQGPSILRLPAVEPQTCIDDVDSLLTLHFPGTGCMEALKR